VICHFSKKYVTNPDSAEDVAQEVFIELWNHRERFNDLSQIKAFLYLAAKNKCMNIIKHLRVKGKYQQSLLSEENETTMFEDEVLHSEAIHNLNMAIDTLPDQRKRIIILGMQGMKNREIAVELDISVNTVKLQKKIAYRRLREMLKPSILLILVL
jgi:RNA polymerase sigma-70 factor (ECF subfamily)